MRVGCQVPFSFPALPQLPQSPVNLLEQFLQNLCAPRPDVFERPAPCAPQPPCFPNTNSLACCFPFPSLDGVQGGSPTGTFPAPSPTSSVFVIGDLKKFGGNTVRQGFKDMLRPSQGQADRPGERTHSALSPEDAAKVRALLDSQDPAVRATLATKVPNGKSLVIGENGQILDTLDTRQVTGNASLNVGVHARHMGDKIGRNYDRSAGGQITTTNGANYRVAGTELHSPIKIALDGTNAQLNSGNGFNIAMEGFGKAVSKTAGGLNANEAWLVRDRTGDGTVKNGVVDGTDVYGDHNGRFKNGYQDLARDFADEVKVDPATGKRFIDLTNPNSRAARELKLLDANGQMRPASAILKRIDVDAQKVAESDAAGANVIRERANVTYLDGHKALSADQWFATTPA